MFQKRFKKIIISVSLLLLATFSFSQTISLEEIWSGKFYPKTIDEINSLADGKYYTTLSEYGIDKYSYETSNKIETLISGSFSNYTFSPDEKLILLESEPQPIYRHSKLGKYEVYNLFKKTYTKVFDKKAIQEPLFSPDGSKIAFVYQNNLYYQDLKSGNITQITSDGEKNKIINGINDWVYEEEFGFVRNFEWSADGKNIAFVRFDESQVKEIEIPIYYKNLYPEIMKFKYPKAGEENSKVSLFIYNLSDNKSNEIELNNNEKYYIFKLKYSPQNTLGVFTSNRLQNKVDVLSVDNKSHQVQKLFSETSKTWIDTDNIFFQFLKDGSFVMNSSRNGYNHLYLFDKKGKLLNQITKGKWEILEVYGIDENKQQIYYQSTELGANNKAIGVAGLRDNKQTLLTPEMGTHEASFSKNFTYFIDQFSTANTPPVFFLRENNGSISKALEDNKNLLNFIITKEIRPLEFIEIPNEKGDKLKAWFIAPKNFDKNKKYPVLMYTYGGPGIQTVNNSWDSFNYWWYQMLAQQGYIVVSVDGRGTGGRGDAFKKQTYKQLGKLELEDQIAAANWLKKQTFVDANRIGIWGWSFGGYLTSLCMTKGENTFKMGIAVAPVTNWRYYDTVYTERFLQTPQENPKGYDDNSPINFAQNLTGKYLLIHGTADDNVHFQNSIEMIEALVQAGKDFDMAIYPDKNHGIYGGRTRLQLYQKMTNFIKQNL